MNTNNWIDAKKQLPPDGQYVIWFKRGQSQCIAYFSDTTKRWWSQSADINTPDFWQPLPEPPPKPDAFEEWWSKQRKLPQHQDDFCCGLSKSGNVTYKDEARAVWDAATKAAKEGK